MTGDRMTKGLAIAASLSLDDVAGKGWRLLAGDTPTPVAVLHEGAVNHNIEVMARFCAAAGVAIAPHGKTTMTPDLVRRQLRAGAWGITAANAHQAAALVGAGVRRVLIANEVVDPHALSWLANTLRDQQDVELLWYVDSVRGLHAARDAVFEADRAARLLVELGHDAGRTGLRDDDEAIALARQVAASPRVQLAGVAGYEGTISSQRDGATEQSVREFVERIANAHERCATEGLLADDAIVTAGGSLFFDVVAEVLAPRSVDSTVVLRSGCYVTHDHGLYASGTPSGLPSWAFEPFRPALEVWCRVVSRPEPDLVLLDAGRRDLSHDAGLPTPLAWSRPSSPGRRPLRGATVPALSDQHAFVRVAADSEVAVGDLVGLGISHPCTTFDRWPVLLLLDQEEVVTGAVETLW